MYIDNETITSLTGEHNTYVYTCSCIRVFECSICAYQHCLYCLQSGQPLLDKYPGKFNFSVEISSSKKPSNFLEKVNTFFVQTQTNFAVEINVSFPDVTAAPPALCVRVMVCYSDPTHLSEHGPIVPCSCNTHTATRSECVCVSFTSYIVPSLLPSSVVFTNVHQI